MSESCIINGVRCTSCCRSIAMPMPLSFYRNVGRGDAEFVGRNWKPLKPRQAKKQNPYAFAHVMNTKRKFYWYRCSKVTESGCSVHLDRPQVCSGYPLYGNMPENIAMNPPEYHQECTEWPRIPAVNV